MLEVSTVTLAMATPEERETGLLGWISCVIGGDLMLDGIALRRTLDRRLALSFPWREDRHGQKHFYMRPVDDRSRREFERQILEALAAEGGG